KETYDKMTARLEKLASRHYANGEYATSYLKRFVSHPVEAAAAATSAPNKLIAVLPDEWRFNWDEEGKGTDAGFAKPDFDDGAWKRVATYSKTLDAQGLPDKLTTLWYRTTVDVPAQHGKPALVFTLIDGAAEVFVNGVSVGGSAKRNAPFEVDASAAA